MLQSIVRILIEDLLALCLWGSGGGIAAAMALPPQADLELGAWTIRDLGSVDEAGTIPKALNEAAVWPVARNWEAGTPLAVVLRLGDLRDLSVETLAGYQLSLLSGVPLDNLSLDHFPFLTEQPLRALVESIPSLSGVQLQALAPILALLSQHLGLGVPEPVAGMTLGTALATVPQLGAGRGLRLADLDPEALHGFSFVDVPNASITPLENFKGWKQHVVADIPGLSQVPLGQFPTPLSGVSGVVARIDAVYGPAEANRQNTITGSDQVGFQAPCAANCAYLELDEAPELGRTATSALRGKQFISGKYQAVEVAMGP